MTPNSNKKVRLITQSIGLEEYQGKTIDEIVVGIARISSSRETNDLFQDPSKLLRHCLLQQHWSIFDTVNLGMEIKTSRAMGREMLRHDFKKQEFSQRYAPVTQFEPIEIRRQATNNRQSSLETFDPIINGEMSATAEITELLDNINTLYGNLLVSDVAREVARLILPETTQTTLYLNGTLRIWLSFLNQRLHKTAQKEIRLIAQEVAQIFKEKCPIISQMMFNFDNAYNIHIFERLVLEKYKIYDEVTSRDKA